MMAYTARIFTATDQDPDQDTEVWVTTQPADDDEIVLGQYVLDVLDVGDATDPLAVLNTLRDLGWRPTGEPPTEVEPGVTELAVEPADWTVIVGDATRDKLLADTKAAHQDRAWRTLIRNSLLDPATNKTAIAAAAGISRNRAYQIRDGKRQ